MLTQLEAHVTQLANEEGFIHHTWFIDHHLKIIEQLVNELCDLYPHANRTVCLAMVWLHDLGKIITNKQKPREEEDRITLEESGKLLTQFGFSAQDTALTLACLQQMEALKSTPATSLHIETKIISSADAAAHYIGPFFALYWYENPTKSIESLITDNITKLQKDQHKVLLPEVETFLQPRFALLAEYARQNRPAKYL